MTRDRATDLRRIVRHEVGKLGLGYEHVIIRYAITDEVERIFVEALALNTTPAPRVHIDAGPWVWIPADHLTRRQDR